MGYEYTNRAVAKQDRQNRNSGVYTRTLFGQSIHENPVPVWTASREHDPFVTLKDPVSGKKIGISKDMLSYGLVAFADPGGGKTNLLDIIVDQLLVTQEDNDIMVILDTKGDYYREFGRRIPEYARIVIGAGEE